MDEERLAVMESFFTLVFYLGQGNRVITPLRAQTQIVVEETPERQLPSITKVTNLEESKAVNAGSVDQLIELRDIG